MKTYAKLTLLAMMAAFLLGIHPALGQAIPTQPASRPTENRAPRRHFPVRWVNPTDTSPPGVQHKTFHSACMNCDVGYCIYTPPGYDNSDTRYPVMYWLHGRGGDELLGLHAVVPRLHQAIISKQIPPMLMVTVNGGSNTMYCDSVDRTILPDTMIVKELIPYIDSHYRTIPKREARVIEGYSMGGFGALKFAFKYPELFCSVVGGSPVLLQWERMSEPQHAEMAKRMFANDAKAFESEHPTTWLKKNADKIRGKVCIRIVVGDQERGKPYNDALCKLLDELKIPHQYEVLEGIGHSGGKVYEKAGLKGFQFQAAALAGAGGMKQQ